MFDGLKIYGVIISSGTLIVIFPGSIRQVPNLHLIGIVGIFAHHGEDLQIDVNTSMAVRKLPRPKRSIPFPFRELSRPPERVLGIFPFRTNLTARAAATAVADPNSPVNLRKSMIGQLKSAAEIIALTCFSQFARSPAGIPAKTAPYLELISSDSPRW